MRIYIIVYIALLFSCNEQSSLNKRNEDTTYTILKEDINKLNNRNFLETYLSKYIDSINLAKSEKELPLFLNDTQFDYNNKGAWESFHNPISVRSQVVERINNCKVLKIIKESKNENFTKKPFVEEKLIPPYIEFSLYDLVVERMKTLNCK